MTFKSNIRVLCWTLVFFTACCIQKTTSASKNRYNKSTPKVQFPISHIALPQTNFKFILPEAPQLATLHAPKKEISETFSQYDKRYVSVKDPKLFQENDTEIIDLTAIPENEYSFPLPNGKVISPYGGRRRHHSGADIKTYAKDTIVSAFDGIVRMARPFAAYGNVIVVRHYNGLETVYSHNFKNFVKPGDRVKAGQPIALTGRTGRATTEHLHFETRINGVHFNPNIVFNMHTHKLCHRCLICTRKGNHVIVKSVDLMPHQMEGAYVPPIARENKK